MGRAARLCGVPGSAPSLGSAVGHRSGSQEKELPFSRAVGMLMSTPTYLSVLTNIKRWEQVGKQQYLCSAGGGVGGGDKTRGWALQFGEAAWQ